MPRLSASASQPKWTQGVGETLEPCRRVLAYDDCTVVSCADVDVVLLQVGDVFRSHLFVVTARPTYPVPPIKQRSFFRNARVALDSVPASFVRWVNGVTEPGRPCRIAVVFRSAPQHPRTFGIGGPDRDEHVERDEQRGCP